MVTPGQAERVLDVLQVKKPEGFSTHDFIEEYCSQNETYYIIWLLRKSGRGTAFQAVHSQIGRYLADHENDRGSRYRRTMRGDSENVHGTIDQPMWWEWKEREE